MATERVTRVVAAWSHMAEHGGEETAAEFPDLVQNGRLHSDLMELRMAELDARADAAKARAREAEAAVAAARIELALSAIAAACDRVVDEHGLTAGEVAAAAAIAAVMLEESGRADG